jgi:hypothetical protein
MVHCTINTHFYTIIPQGLWKHLPQLSHSPIIPQRLTGSYQNLTADQRGLVNGFFFPDEEDGAVGTAPAGNTSFFFFLLNQSYLCFFTL